MGGYAVALHGHPHHTKTLDVWIKMSPENSANLIAALGQFGFGSLGLKPSDFLDADQIIQLGLPPNRIDLLTSIPGVEFASCYPSRAEVLVGEVLVDFIDLDNLKRNKKAAGRHQDLADLENLE